MAATSIKNLLTDNWTKISAEEKISIKDYCLQFLATKAVQSDKNIMRMMLLLIARICKMSWLDNLELKNIVTEIQ